ncbi:MAG: PadR family transcriptional regulator [Gemmatimonadota bacterium]
MKEMDAAAFLPLKPVWFHVLLALGDGPRHGYAIGTAVEELTDGGLRMWPATLYGSIHQLEQHGLVEHVEVEPEPDDDARRRYYQLTLAGRRVLAAETERLRQLVKVASRVRALREA